MDNIINSVIRVQKNKYKSYKQWKYFYSIENILNFIKYNGFILKEIIPHYKKAIKYRSKLYALTYNCEKCIVDNTSHSIEIVDNHNIIITPSKATDKDVFYICKHLSMLVDILCNKDSFIGSIKLYINFEDYNLIDIMKDINITKELLNMIQLCYPLIFSDYILLNTPSYFYPILDTLKTIMDDDMINKIQII